MVKLIISTFKQVAAIKLTFRQQSKTSNYRHSVPHSSKVRYLILQYDFTHQC